MKQRLFMFITLACVAAGAPADFEIVSISPLAKSSSSLFTTSGMDTLQSSSSAGEFPSYSGFANAGQTIGTSSVTAASDFSLFLTTNQVITNGFANSGVSGGPDILSAEATADSDIEIVFSLDGPHHYIIHSVESQSQNATGAVVLLEEHRHEIFRYEHTHVHEIVGNLDAGTYTLLLTAGTTSSWTNGGALSVALFDLEFEIAEGSACPGDLNADGGVDDADFVLFAAAYDQLTCMPAVAAARHGGCFADFNGDAVVDDSDFVVFAAAYNQLVCP